MATTRSKRLSTTTQPPPHPPPMIKMTANTPAPRPRDALGRFVRHRRQSPPPHPPSTIVSVSAYRILWFRQWMVYLRVTILVTITIFVTVCPSPTSSKPPPPPPQPNHHHHTNASSFSSRSFESIFHDVTDRPRRTLRRRNIWRRRKGNDDDWTMERTDG